MMCGGRRTAGRRRRPSRRPRIPLSEQPEHLLRRDGPLLVDGRHGVVVRLGRRSEMRAPGAVSERAGGPLDDGVRGARRRVVQAGAGGGGGGGGRRRGAVAAASRVRLRAGEAPQRGAAAPDAAAPAARDHAAAPAAAARPPQLAQLSRLRLPRPHAGGRPPPLQFKKYIFLIVA